MSALRSVPSSARRAGQRGFTLIEVMVVIVIIGIMAALVVPNLAGRQEQAQVTAARNDLATYANALDLYKMDNFTYPSTEQGLAALAEKPSGFPEAKNWKAGGYVRSLRDDPWGNPYRYLASGDRYELYSLGADGQEGGEGFAEDIDVRDL